MRKNLIFLFIICICTFLLTTRYLKKEQAPDNVISVEEIPHAEPMPIATPEVASTVAPIQKKQEAKLGGFPIEVLREQSEDPSFLPFDAEGNLYIENVVIDGDFAIAHGDVLVGDAEQIKALERNGGNLFLPKPRLWTNAEVPYSISNSIPSAQAQSIHSVIQLLEQTTRVRFIKATNEKDRLTFKAGGEHCYSNVGRIGGEQYIVLNSQCGFSQILHETLHALGLYHEQSRPDRDDHIMIMWENIEERFHEQFKKMPPLHFSLSDAEFDITSIMMYPPQAFSRFPEEPSILTINGEIYTPKTTLSSGDIEKIKILYGEAD